MTKQQLLKMLSERADWINEELASYFENRYDNDLKELTEAQKYSVMAGGKRIRPIIALAFSELFGGKYGAALPYCVALEMIHTASLIHDDLPCIDNDELRRGRPTNHVVYGESTALLAGDGLLMDAFGVVAQNRAVPAELNLQAISILSELTGSCGLVGGEFLDIMGEDKDLPQELLEKLYDCKTGALIRASAILGALSAGVSFSDERMMDAIMYADGIGLAFQIIDDILDVRGDASKLGKNPGSDERENKTTYLSFYSIEEAEDMAYSLTRVAKSAVSKYEGSEFLEALADYLLSRDN
jgi:geranylgeranyl diphosphate synthase type II